MDTVDWKEMILAYVKKFRLVFLIFLIGIFLMLIPESQAASSAQDEPKEITAETLTLQEALSDILSKLEGAGKTQVLLTEAAGEQTYYQSNETNSTNGQEKDQRKDTVLVTNSERDEMGLIRRIDPPVYQGAVVLCQGAGNAQVRLSIVEAVSNATGLSTDKITVLKMK